MPEPSHHHPLRGYSPFRALALRLREQFRAEDEARAAALEAALARHDAARTPSRPERRSRRLVH